MSAADLSAISVLQGQMGRLQATTNAAPGGAASGLDGSVHAALASRIGGMNFPGSAPVFRTSLGGGGVGIPSLGGEFGIASGFVDPQQPTISTTGEAGSQVIPVNRNAHAVTVPSANKTLPLPAMREFVFIIAPETQDMRAQSVHDVSTLQGDVRKLLDGPRNSVFDITRRPYASTRANQLMQRLRNEEHTHVLTPVPLKFFCLCEELAMLRAALLGGGGGDYATYKASLYSTRSIAAMLERFHFDGVAWENQPFGDDAGPAGAQGIGDPTKMTLTVQAAGPLITVVDYWGGKATPNSHLFIRWVRTKYRPDEVPSFNFAATQRENYASAEYPPQPALQSFQNKFPVPANAVVCPLDPQFVALPSRFPTGEWTTYETYDGQRHYDGVMQYIGKVVETYPSAQGVNHRARSYSVGASTGPMTPDTMPKLTNRYALLNNNPPLLVVLQPSYA